MNTLPLFDTHAHLDFPEFEQDRVTLIQHWEAENVVGVIIPGIDVASSQRILDIASFSVRFHAAVAIHPNHTLSTTEDDWQTICGLAQRDDVVAIGETGLDRYWDDAPFNGQIDMFHRHIELSQETDKPILIHCRDAWDDLLPILQQAGKLCGVIHAFSGNTEQMQKCVELGFFISFAGSVTYRNAKFSHLWEAAKEKYGSRIDG